MKHRASFIRRGQTWWTTLRIRLRREREAGSSHAHDFDVDRAPVCLEVVAWRQARRLLLDQRDAGATSAWFREDLGRLFDLLATGAIRPRVAGRISFDEVADAHRRLEAGGLGGRLVPVPGTPVGTRLCAALARPGRGPGNQQMSARVTRCGLCPLPAEFPGMFDGLCMAGLREGECRERPAYELLLLL